MELDESKNFSNTACGQQICLRGMDATPDIPILAAQRDAAIVWMIPHLVVYRLQNQRRLSPTDYMDFLYRARWKEYHRKP
jgi:hypothetical protein